MWEDYASFAALDAAATPTRRATRTRISAIVEAEEVTAAETLAMKPRPARSNMIAIAITYPRIGRTVSIRPMNFHHLTTATINNYHTRYKDLYIEIAINIVNNMSRMVTTTITITEEQKKWIEDNSLNLSKFVRKRLEEEMRKRTK